MNTLHQWLRLELLQLADPAYLQSIRTLVPMEGEVIGVRVPALRELARTLHRGPNRPSLEEACALMDATCAQGCREEILFATFLLTYHRKKLTREMWPRIDRWVDALDNWETCDQLAMNIAGEIVHLEPQLIQDLVTWAGSKNPWRRRFAVACTTVLNQKGRSHPAATIQVCEPLLADGDASVQKAVGWALREACKGGASDVFAFLSDHRHRIPRRLLRDASEKLTVEQQKALL